ncbi:hypothetical protein DY000_02035365 [Brassica cretica]|uniref:RNase H type-1 domain-containing protein n=1 Tax=Brassica cretica TaxID=69181 RepID=A0ABQ7DWV0_BRACR|nr:hypothetical protein DY000_02035365 [Brassica cretica]
MARGQQVMNGWGWDLSFWRRRKRSYKDCTHIAQSPIHAEAEGIIWAMKKARARGLDDINFASDCQQLMNLVNRDEEWPALSTELDEIKFLLSKFQSVVLTFLPRSCNIRADSLAKGGHSRVHYFAAVNSLGSLFVCSRSSPRRTRMILYESLFDAKKKWHL